MKKNYKLAILSLSQPRKSDNEFLNLFKYNSMMTAIMLLLDMMLLHQSAVFVEKQVEDMDTSAELRASSHDDVTYTTSGCTNDMETPRNNHRRQGW